MNGIPSSTWFTTAPHWQWYIVFYFFIGGLAGGCYFLAAIIDLLGRRVDRPIARLGYYVAFPAVLLSGLLLTLDLSRPLRFWHMLIERNTLEPSFKYWSPMSIGSWALMIFGAFTFVSFLAALADDDRVRSPLLRRFQWPALRALRAPSVAGKIVAVLGGVAGFYIAGYTGILLAVTNRPIWSDTPLLGMLFVASAASTSAALLVLLAQRAKWQLPGLADLRRFDDSMIVLELLVLAAVLVSLGPVLQAWLNAWGVLLVLGVVVVGLIVPLALSWRARSAGTLHAATPAVLVLIGGFLLRVVIVLSSESVSR
jgi:formate-dependent nitrite reductase membrane component NrfD